MKKVLSLMLTAILLMGIFVIPIRASAATATVPSAGVVDTGGGRLNVRAKPSTAGAWVASLTDGATVTLYEKTGDWWRVEYAAGKLGYCHADYITPIAGSAATVSVGTSTLNVRRGPGTSYARLGSLKNGTQVVVLSTSGGWSRILYAGTSIGYVSATYLKATMKYAPVSLAVPCYRQWDSRWGSIRIGSSGKTISQIGCATSGIAMLESYRTGTTLTPATMVKRLSYTASGNVYWPSHFDVHYWRDGYLADVYAHLAAGRPVLIGAKTASGGQHWVVITGYTGGDDFSPDRFTIHDPGVSTRKTLADFFAAYPIFYKYFTY